MGQKQPKMTPKWPKTVGKTAKKWSKTPKNDPKWPEMMGKMAKMKPKTAKNSGFVLSWQSCPPTAGVSPRGDGLAAAGEEDCAGARAVHAPNATPALVFGCGTDENPVFRESG